LHAFARRCDQAGDRGALWHLPASDLPLIDGPAINQANLQTQAPDNAYAGGLLFFRKWLVVHHSRVHVGQQFLQRPRIDHPVGCDPGSTSPRCAIVDVVQQRRIGRIRRGDRRTPYIQTRAVHMLSFDGIGMEGNPYFVRGSRRRPNGDRINLLACARRLRGIEPAAKTVWLPRRAVRSHPICPTWLRCDLADYGGPGQSIGAYTAGFNRSVAPARL
jgi:hypothetical protein